MKKIKTLSVLGATASGKSALAVELATRLGGEIVSCDSMQLYREMNIGTATPSLEERGGIVHHLFDIVPPEADFSAAEYARAASAAIEETASRGKLPILCGGTGMYFDSLMKITSFSEGEKDDALREELFEYAAENGNTALHEKLKKIDPIAAEAIHPNNVKRVVRAIEIYETTGKTKTETDRKQVEGEIPYDNFTVIIDFLDRAKLYDRIEKRVDIMMSEGLEEEVKSLFCSGRKLSQTASQAIGYKEFFPYFAGEKTKEEITSDIKLATRHYAKRQLIWFRHYKDAFLVHPDEGEVIKGATELADEVVSKLNEENFLEE